MSLFTRRKGSPTSVTAAARPIPPSDHEAVRAVSSALRPWQTLAWKHYNDLAEIHYPAAYKGNALSRFRLHIAKRPADLPAADPIEVTSDADDLDRAAQDILSALGGDLGGPEEILRLYGINMTIAADAWLVGEDRAGETNWEMLSISEMRANGEGNYQRFPMGGTTPMEDAAWKPNYVHRMWRPHPQFTQLADGAMQSLSADCERLLVLNRSLTARILSKLAQAGYFFVPSGMTITGAPEAPTGNGPSITDPLMVKLLGDAERSVLDGRGSFIPTGIRGPAAEGEAIRFISMDRTIDRVEMELRAELRSNIAGGMDLPREVQEGMAGGNHWSTWAVSDSSYKDHIVPDASAFVKAITKHYLWPLLRDWNEAAGSRFTEADIRRRCIDGDGSAVVSRPNGSEDARQLSDRIVISDEALRRRSGVGEEEAPSEEQFVRQLGRQIKNPYLATLGLAIHDKIDWEAVAKVPAGEGAPGAGGTPPSRRPTDNGTPGAGPKGSTASADPAVWAAVASGHLAAAAKVVGAKVRARCEPHPDVFAEVKRIPNERVLASIELTAIELPEGDVTQWCYAALRPLEVALLDLGADTALAEAYAWRIARAFVEHPTTPPDLAEIASTVLSPTAP